MPLLQLHDAAWELNGMASSAKDTARLNRIGFFIIDALLIVKEIRYEPYWNPNHTPESGALLNARGQDGEVARLLE